MGIQVSDATIDLGQRLVDWFDPSRQYVVALSGGVDSAVVACGAKRAGVSIVAVTARGPSLSQREWLDAQQLAAELHLQHHGLQAGEHLSQDYQRNDARRCFHCKSHLFAAILVAHADKTILTGTNLDDLSDYRPGLEAARLAEVRSPLAELKIGKSQVRQLAHYWQLPVADKPASPCLASRIAYGVPVTPERLKMIEAAEALIRNLLPTDDCRVRVHEGELARIEVPQAVLHIAMQPAVRERLLTAMRDLGFQHVTVDLAGLRSGSLNPPIQIQLASHQHKTSDF